jgi:hypothetical protein
VFTLLRECVTLNSSPYGTFDEKFSFLGVLALWLGIALFNALPLPSLPKGGVPGIPWPVSLRVRDEEDLLEVSERVSSSIEKKRNTQKEKEKKNNENKSQLWER